LKQHNFGNSFSCSSNPRKYRFVIVSKVII
jgi:hypothetical protein